MAAGKYAWSISQRSGLRFPYAEMIREPGTNLWVHKTETDGHYNRVDHPRNFPRTNIADDITLNIVRGNNSPIQSYLWDSAAGFLALDFTGMNILLENNLGDN